MGVSMDPFKSDVDLEKILELSKEELASSIFFVFADDRLLLSGAFSR